MEVSVSSLARMAQAPDYSSAEYLYRFKVAKNWCKVPLPEKEYVKISQNDLTMEFKKKFSA